jgi:pectate lyase
LGQIHLEAGLHLPSDTTLDGGCGGITLSGPPRITQLTLTDVSNVIIAGLAFTKDAYDDKADKTGDAIGLTDQFDRVAILHNAFHRCGDGCVDIVRKTRFPTESRATVAFNHFSEHNKVMLIGTLTCYKDGEAEGCHAPLRHLADLMAPRVTVTVQANVFEGTSQRHPKVVSNAAVQLANNLFLLRPTAYSSGSDSAVYGSATGTGGVLRADGNIFVNPDQASRIGAGPISVVRAASGGGSEADGAVAAADNVTVGNVSVVEQDADLARRVPMPAVSIRALSRENAAGLAACLLRIAGPKGSSAIWPEACGHL